MEDDVGEFEVDEETDDYQIDEIMRSSQIGSTLLQSQNRSSNDTCLGGKSRTKELIVCWHPDSTNQLFHKSQYSRSSSFGSSDQNLNEIRVGVEFGSMRDSMRHFIGSLHFLHHSENTFDRGDFGDFVDSIERCVEYQIPDDCCEDDVVVSFEWSNHWFTEKEVGKECVGEAHEHA